jgi:hypothetical protein
MADFQNMADLKENMYSGEGSVGEKEENTKNQPHQDGWMT